MGSSPSNRCLSALFPFVLVSFLVVSTLRVIIETVFLNNGWNRGTVPFSIAIESFGSVKNAEEHAEVLEHGCNLFEGKWIMDEKIFRPLYTEESCPYLTRQVTCLSNGRPDSLYQKWRWKPKSCEMPRSFEPLSQSEFVFLRQLCLFHVVFVLHDTFYHAYFQLCPNYQP